MSDPHLAMGNFPPDAQLEAGVLWVCCGRGATLTGLVHRVVRSAGVRARSLHFTSQAVGGRCLDSLCRWARRRRFRGGIRVDLPRRAALDPSMRRATPAVRALGRAGVRVRHRQTCVQSVRIDWTDRARPDMVIWCSQSLDSGRGRPRVEAALVAPAGHPLCEGVILRCAQGGRLTPGALAKHIARDCGWSGVSIVTRHVDRVSLAYVGGSAKRIVHGRMPAGAGPGPMPRHIEARTAPVSARWATGWKGGRLHGCLTSADLTRDAGENCIIPLPESLARPLERLAERMAGSDRPLALGPEAANRP